MFKRGIDLSHWQGTFYPSIAIERGVEFVIFKGTDFFKDIEKGFIDYKVLEYIDLAENFNLPFGVYMWFKPKHDAVKQADFFIDLFKKVNPNFAPIVDVEEPYSDLNTALYKLQIILERLEEKLETVPIIYSRNTIINTYNKNKRGFLIKYPYWQAFYPYKNIITKEQYRYFEDFKYFPKAAEPFEKTSIWQFSEKGDGRYYGVSSSQLDLNLALELPPSKYKEKEIKRVMITATLGLRVREQPNLQSKIIRIIPYKNIVEVEGEEEKFYKIKDGYIYKLYTKVIE